MRLPTDMRYSYLTNIKLETNGLEYMEFCRQLHMDESFNYK